MSNIEEDYKLFQLVKRNPINSCKDLSKNMIGKKRGIFYFTELFRIDFENKMSDFERLKEEREQDKKRIKELEEENKLLLNSKVGIDLSYDDYIPVQKVKVKIEELDIAILECEYDDDDVEEYKNDVEKEKRILLIKKSALEELLEEK